MNKIEIQNPINIHEEYLIDRPLTKEKNIDWLINKLDLVFANDRLNIFENMQRLGYDIIQNQNTTEEQFKSWIIFNTLLANMRYGEKTVYEAYLETKTNNLTEKPTQLLSAPQNEVENIMA